MGGGSCGLSRDTTLVSSYELTLHRVTYDECPERLFHVCRESSKAGILAEGILCGAELAAIGRGNRAYVHLVAQFDPPGSC